MNTNLAILNLIGTHVKKIAFTWFRWCQLRMHMYLLHIKCQKTITSLKLS